MSGKIRKKMRQRIVGIAVLMSFIIFGMLIYRLVVLQIIDAGGYQERALNQQLATVPFKAPRGTIYDRNQKALARSASTYIVAVSPNSVKDKDVNDLARELSRILGLDAVKVTEKLQQKKSSYVRLKMQVTQDKVDELREYTTTNEIGVGALSYETDFTRYYPYEDFAASVLGFTGYDHNGLRGLEYTYDDILSGIDGKQIRLQDGVGGRMEYAYEDADSPIAGKSIITTIDEEIQHYAEKHLSTAVLENNVGNRAAAIVMDVNTGEILAMASKEDFDPNNYQQIFNQDLLLQIQSQPEEQQEKLIADARGAQWKNKAISETYEPGSVFKIITAAAALDSGTSSMDTTFYCSGSVKIPGNPKLTHCHRKAGHGTQDFTHALMNSCNPAFVSIADRMGVDTFYKYFKAFGFTEKTGIDLEGEQLGQFHGEDMTYLNMAISSFGQTFTVTPIQLITAVSATVNGGNLMQPYIVKNIIDEDGSIIETISPTVKRPVISAETSEKMRYMLEQVVGGEGGTGKNAYVKGYRIGGKTGTSEKTETRDESGNVQKTISSFLGVAPMDDPKIAVLVLLDEPEDLNAYGSTIAAPVVGQILKDVLESMEIQPKYTAAELENIEVSVPNVIGQNSLDALSAIRNAGFDPYFDGEGGTIIKQVPSAGSLLSKGSTVIIYTEDVSSENEKQAQVPNIIGMSAAQANSAITNAGLNIKIIGGGLNQEGAVVISQSIPDGLMVPIGSIVEVKFVVEDQVF